MGEQTFEGFTTGEDWNGFAVLFFELNVAHQIIDSLSKIGISSGYDSDEDAFWVISDGSDDEELFFSTESEGRKYYPIGSGSWIWEEA
ncbi:MAG: hypothetical protein EOP04_27830 [Proteobacteria bacterium]|nr:MAG: hypothetical protein EOP04_27830 [Pseudomonadota bacterium]